MSRRPWYKRYPSDFITGTINMTLDEKGAYSMVLDLIYDRGGPIADDSQWIARVCGCSTRKWNQLRNRLIELGKIHVNDSLISNEKAATILSSGKIERDYLVENGAKGGEQTKINHAKVKEQVDENQTTCNEANNLAEKGLLSSGQHSRRCAPAFQKLDSTIPKGMEPDRLEGSVDLLGDMPLPTERFDPLQVFFGKQSGSALSYLTANGVIEKQARSMLGKWRKAHGDDAVVAAVKRASEATASEPIPFIEATLRGGDGPTLGPKLTVVEEERIIEQVKQNALAQAAGGRA